MAANYVRYIINLPAAERWIDDNGKVRLDPLDAQRFLTRDEAERIARYYSSLSRQVFCVYRLELNLSPAGGEVAA